MPLQAFSFPVSETRLFRAGSLIYKFKIRGGSSYSGEENVGGHCFSQEIEEIIRTVLSNLDSLQPFSSTHYNVFPYKKRWEGASKTMCRHRERNLKAYPFVLIVYLEKNGKRAEQKSFSKKEARQQIPSVSEPPPKRHKSDSPLEEAILKDLMRDLEPEKQLPVVSRPYRDNPQEVEEVKRGPEFADKKEKRVFVRRQQKPGSGTPSEMRREVGDGEADEAAENADSVPKSPAKPGILTRLASHIFPFSLFFRDP